MLSDRINNIIIFCSQGKYYLFIFTYSIIKYSIIKYSIITYSIITYSIIKYSIITYLWCQNKLIESIQVHISYLNLITI